MTIHEELKLQTRPLHDKLERDLDLLRADFTRDDYTELLKRFYGIYSVLEPHLALTPERRKTHKILADLDYLGVKNISDIPLCKTLPETSDESFVWGILYVLEGSTLGGQVLRKHFEEKLNLLDQGLSFFSGHGPLTMQMWKRFQSDLTTFGQSKKFNPKRVIQGANSTFRLLNDWLI